MPRVARSETFLTKQLSLAEQEALADEVAPPIFEMFGVPRDAVFQNIFAAKSDVTKLLVHRNAEGKVVGYFVIHFFDKRLRGVPTTVVRAGVGMLRDYRGQNNNLSWALKVLAEHLVANPRKPLYGLGAMVHPSSYMQVARYVEVYWPKPHEPVPAEILDFMLELADEFHMQLIDPARPLARRSIFKTIQTDAERDYWRRRDDPAARFFMSTVPEYGEGAGLLTLFPITPAMLAGTAARYARDKAKRAIEGALATAQRLPIGATLLRPSEVRKRLRAVPLFSALDDASLARLVAESEIASFSGGKEVFREGDLGDDIYLVARGAVSVLGGAGDDGMIDQLGAGSLFGEVAMLSGGRRSASIRTAIPSTLVRIPGSPLRALMDERRDVGDAIWSAFAARVFDDHLRASARAPELGRPARQAWIRRGRHEDLAPGARVDPGGDAFLLVLNGVASIEQGATPLSANAPIVIEPDASTRVVAKTAVRVVHVPPLRASIGVTA